MLRRDKYTGKLFIPKRSNQLFATPENRIAYNNEKAKKWRQKMAPIIKPINKNRQILEELMEGRNERIVHKEFLLGKGFDFGFSPNTYTQNGETYFALADFHIIPKEDYNIQIIRHE